MLELNNNMVYGDSRSLRNFFNDLCDSIEKQEAMWDDVAEMENKLDEAIGIEEHRDELMEEVIKLQEIIRQKDEEIERLQNLLEERVTVDKAELKHELEETLEVLKKPRENKVTVPKIPVKKKILKKVK